MSSTIVNRSAARAGLSSDSASSVELYRKCNSISCYVVLLCLLSPEIHVPKALSMYQFVLIYERGVIRGQNPRLFAFWTPHYGTFLSTLAHEARMYSFPFSVYLFSNVVSCLQVNRFGYHKCYVASHAFTLSCCFLHFVQASTLNVASVVLTYLE
jgi:hypothetical protein